MRLSSFRPRPSMVIAVIALVAAVTGTSYAAFKVDSGDVKNRSLKGKDLRKNTVGGKEIKESKLRQVPKAKDARFLRGEKASDLKVRWLLLNERGVIEDQSGGFTVIDIFQTNTNAYIDAGESLEGKGLTASIAIQNQVDVNGDGTADPMMGVAGEVSVTRCQIPGVVECAPPGAKNLNALVVSPRNSDGTATTATSRKRVYVQVTE